MKRLFWLTVLFALGLAKIIREAFATLAVIVLCFGLLGCCERDILGDCIHRTPGSTNSYFAMKRIFLIAIICGLFGCQSLLDKATGVGGSTGGKITIQPDTVYMGENGWTISFSPNMPKNPLATGNGWMFYFPDKDG